MPTLAHQLFGLLLRLAVTLPVELYTPVRECEFDEAEAELAQALAGRAQAGAAKAPTRRRRG